MVRRSTVDRSPQPATYKAGYDAGTGDLAQTDTGRRQRTGQSWRGAGGRWLVWTLRVVMWLVLLIVGYRGVMAIVLNETPPSHSHPARVSHGPVFPTALAGAYALQFGQVYLNASPATAGQRAAALAGFLAPGAPDPQLGWNGGGFLSLQSEQVAGVKVENAHHAIVTLLARVNGKLMELGVPVYVASGALGITGEPAWLAAPASASPPSPPAVPTDTATQGVLAKQLPAFFAAYASGDQSTLDRFLSPGTSVTGLGGSVALGSVTGVTVPAGGAVRNIVTTVVWDIPGQTAKGTRAGNATASLEMSYELTIVRQHGTWYVQSIAAYDQAGGQP
jgi:hypothetical protein